MGWAKTNPDKLDKDGRVAADLVDPNMPPQTNEGKTLVATIEYGKNITQAFKRRSKKANEQETNRQFRNWTLGTIGLGMVPVVGAAVLPSVSAVSIPSVASAYGTTKVVEGLVDAADPGPPSTGIGYAIEAIQSIHSYLTGD